MWVLVKHVGKLLLRGFYFWFPVSKLKLVFIFISHREIKQLNISNNINNIPWFCNWLTYVNQQSRWEPQIHEGGVMKRIMLLMTLTLTLVFCTSSFVSAAMITFSQDILFGPQYFNSRSTSLNLNTFDPFLGNLTGIEVGVMDINTRQTVPILAYGGIYRGPNLSD